MNISDQFAFRPTGSTTSALVTLLSDVTGLLDSNDFVHIISLDFSKAFDTVRHSSLFSKLANICIPDELYNWLASYFTGRSHATKCYGITSQFHGFNAGIVQGSALGPPAFVVTASDLVAVTPGNKLDKYADDTYLVVPGKNSHTIPAELLQINNWATSNNLKLNISKSKEMIVTKPRYQGNLPSILPDIKRVESLNILGVTVTSTLSMSEHVNSVCNKCNSLYYGLKVLKNHGLGKFDLDVTFRSLVLSRITYGSPAWRGYVNASDSNKLNSLLRKGFKWGLTKKNTDLEELLDKADRTLFNSLLSNRNHVLSSLLPPQRQLAYNLRPGPHNFLLPRKNRFSDNNFITRMLFKNIY